MLRWAARARGNRRFDAAEREHRLAIAEHARKLLGAAELGEPLRDRIELLFRLVQRQRNPRVVIGKPFGQLADWASADEASLRPALRPFSERDVAPEDRIGRLARSAASRLADDATTFAVVVGSLLNFATDPEHLPVVRLQALHLLEGLFDEHAATASAPEIYAHHVRFIERVHAALVDAEVPVRDLLDTEALILICWEDRDFWLRPDARPKRAQEPEHYLAACAVYRDEAPYLAEWLEFHLLVGFERFYLYDNVSEDDHLAALAPYLEDGIVVLHDWPRPYVPGQDEAYKHCLDNYGKEARWIGFVDVDEFLFSPTYRPVSEMLRDYEQWPGVAINAPRFGTSGHLTRPEGLVIENYVTHMRMESDRIVKSVVDPAVAEGPQNAHVFRYRWGSAVDENGYTVHYGATKTPSFDRLRINHYYWKSYGELAAKQTGRTAGPARVWRAPPTVEEVARSEAEHGVRDETILPYVEPVRQALERRARAAR
jgi:hypothetical protein